MCRRQRSLDAVLEKNIENEARWKEVILVSTLEQKKSQRGSPRSLNSGFCELFVFAVAL